MRNPKTIKDVERFQAENKIEIKCISDRILLYLRWGAEKLQLEEDDLTMVVYYRVRGEPKYTSRNPRVIAAAILYLGLVYRGIPVLQLAITNLYDIAPHVIRKTYNELIKDFDLKMPKREAPSKRKFQYETKEIEINGEVKKVRSLVVPKKPECGMFRP